MAKFQLLFFTCLTLLILFSSVCQEPVLKDHNLIHPSEISPNDTVGHDVIHTDHDKQKKLVDGSKSEARSELNSHLIVLNNSLQTNMENTIICRKEIIDQHQENISRPTHFRDIKDTKAIGPEKEYNETHKCFKIRKPFCHSPFNNPSSLLVDLQERDRLIDNITLGINFRDSKKLQLVFFVVMIMIIKSKQLNYKAQLSYLKMVLTFNNSLLLKNNLDKYVDNKAILKSCESGMKVKYYEDPVGSPEKAMFQFRHRTAFPNFSQFLVYPVFNMTRLASYRPISLAESPISFSELSEAGFLYSSQDKIIVCECCNKRIKLMSVVSSPSNAIYHNHGCPFISNEMSSENMPGRISNIFGASNFVAPCNQNSNTSQSISIPGLSHLDTSQNATTLGTQMLAIVQEGLQDFGLLPQNIKGPALVKNQNYREVDYSFYENNISHGLEINDLKNLFEDELFVQLLNISVRLTVKIECKDMHMFGSGYSIHFPCRKVSTRSIQVMPEWNDDLKKMFQDNAEVGIVYIETTSHLFPGMKGAIKNTEVSLSLDDGKYKNLKLNGSFVLFSTKKGISQAILVCFTTDMGAVERINELQKDLLSSARNLTEDFKKCISQSIFIISHPYGKEKKFSFGESSLKQYNIIFNNEGQEIVSEYIPGATSSSGVLRKALIYDASLTADGSSGAPVITFTKGEISDLILDVWTHNGLSKTDIKSGVTVMRELIYEENAAVASREVNSKVNSNVSQQRVSPPIFEASIVMNGSTQLGTTYQFPPSYPIYNSKQKRVESFQDWKFTHVMNPNVLAEAGFFFVGYADCVRCFQCGLGLRSWKLGDDVYAEHERYRPTCPLLQSLLSRRNDISSQTVSGNANQVQPHMEMSTISNSVPSQDSPKLQMLLNLPLSDNLVADSNQQTSALDGGGIIDNRNESSSTSFKGSDELENVSVEQSSDIQTTIESSPSQNSPQDKNGGGAKNIEATLLERENKMLHDILKCKLCKEAPVKDLFVPCGDLYACSDCSQKLTHCPACGKRILGTVTTHF